MQLISVLVHTAVWLWRPQAITEEARGGGGNHGHNLFGLFWVQRPHRRRERSANFDCGEAALERFRQALRHSLHTTVKEMPVATPGRFLAELQHEVGAVDSPRQMVSFAPAQPNQWHPVRYNHVCRIQDFLERRIMLSFDDAVHASWGDGMASAAVANPSLHPSQHRFCLYRVDPHSKHFKAPPVLR